MEADQSRVYIRRVRRSDEKEFTRLMRDSQHLHEPWISPPVNAVLFRHYMQRIGQEDHEGFAICRKHDDRIFAVKHQIIEDSEEAEHEKEIWMKLSSPFHPAIMLLYEVIEYGSSMHLVTLLMPAGDLAHVLNETTMSEQCARLVAVQLAGGLQHMHAVHSMAHRDIKPANILVDGECQTKLCDFGFSRTVPLN